MTNKIFILLVALSIVSCATTTPHTDKLAKNRGELPEKAQLIGVPFIQQAEYHCGPATMAMALEHAGKKVDLNELTHHMYTKGLKGTFQSEMISAARNEGMLAIPINDLTSVLKEISAGHPIIVFQNLYFAWLPRWHYALAVGYKLNGPDIILHTGKDKFEEDDMRLFERSWKLGGKWGLLVLRPDQLSFTADDTTHARAAAVLEQLGKLEQAELAYRTILKRWPESLMALIGIGNVRFSAKDFKASTKFLKTATRYHPQSAIAWHNLATAQGAAGLKHEARVSSLKAIELVDVNGREAYQKSLAEWVE